ncbi:hypothetical protein IIA15_00270 [candidate division TA06 bacterium]|nr:hypothetical protein [candidate division TA06 bacterium]
MSTIFATCKVCLKTGELNPEHMVHQGCLDLVIEELQGEPNAEVEELRDELQDKETVISNLKGINDGLASTMESLRNKIKAYEAATS